MFHKSFLFLSAIIFILCQCVKAQLGPVIISPAQNATVPVNNKLDIVYQYQNMGTGNYTVDIQLWQDGAVSSLISNITTNHPVKSGNSTGFQVAFKLNDTYTWTVPRGLNSTFWLTVTESTQTSYYTKGLRLRSRPVMLHPSAASVYKPASIALLFVMSFITLVIFS